MSWDTLQGFKSMCRQVAIRRLLDACRVPDSVPERSIGLWEIRRFTIPDRLTERDWARDRLDLGAHDGFTALLRTTVATLMEDIGESVMEDSPRELRRHLPILLTARGRVLVSGLGLGCVLRGLLAKPRVEHVDVVEISPSVMELVGPEFADNSRVTLHLGDAETIQWATGTRWDFAWHDVWSEDEALPLVHARLFVRYDALCERQGAWQFPREVKRRWPRPLLGARRRRTP